jgi:hypothetical protein
VNIFVTPVIDTTLSKVLAALDVHTAHREVLPRGLDLRKNGPPQAHTFPPASDYLPSYQISQTHNVALASRLTGHVVSLGRMVGLLLVAAARSQTDAEEPDEVAKPGEDKLTLAKETAKDTSAGDTGVRLFLFSAFRTVGSH